ncbi:MAG: tRNA pseudouridine(13) synthase TruD [Candidatus Diapherotrites archaeon]
MTDYYTKTPGTGGRIRQRVSDFAVEEIAPNGSACEVKAFSDKEKTELEHEWPENTENREHLIVEMEKFGYDTHSALKQIARSLRCSPKRMGFAGLKDKRAITCQRVSIWNPDLERVKTFRSRYLDLRFLEWSDERIELGDLKGNRFRIVIRGIELDEKETRKRLEACAEEMKEGIPNFFGEQRFGGLRQVTHVVGKLFLQGKTKEAVMAYLSVEEPREGEEVCAARKLARAEKFAEALHLMPYKFKFERILLQHLEQNPNDFAGAFQKLPKSLRYLFTHAVQSHLYNEILKERLKRGFGLNAVEGDVVEDGVPTIPLFGFESKFSKGVAGEIEKMVLEREGVSLKEFQVRELAEMSSKGSRKRIVLKAENLEIGEIGRDEYNEGKIKAAVSFELEKGNYATTVLDELLKVSA